MSYARVVLHLSKDEFYSLTPAEFYALKRQHEAQVKREEFHREYLNGILVAAIVNHSLNLPVEPASPADFMPCMKQKEHTGTATYHEDKTPAQAVDDVRDFFRHMNELRDNRP